MLVGLSKGVSSFECCCGCCWHWNLFSGPFFFNGFELGFLVLGRGGIFAGARMLELKEFCGAEVGLVLVCIFNPNSDD